MAERRRGLLVGAVTAAVVAGAVVGWQVRAAQAAERRHQAAEQAKEAAARRAQTPLGTAAAAPSRPPTAVAASPTPTTLPTASASPTPEPSATPEPTVAPAARPSAAPAQRPAGAGPDCGGPDSYEPPVDDGRTLFFTSTPTASGNGSNGRVPASAMASLGWCTDSQGNKQWLRADASAALTRVNKEFRATFGENIAVDLSYRSYDEQVAMRSYYGTLAARPGTSNHGLGTAIDTWEWAAYGFGSARYDWLVLHGPDYGWSAPAWARAQGSNPEYWHFEYTG